MRSETEKQHSCSCGATGVVHTAGCSCHNAEEFLAGPTAAYMASRRDFLKHAMAGGLTVAAVSLLGTEALASDPFKPSVSDQKKLGNQAAEDVLKKYKLVTDSRSRRFQKVGARMVDALTSKERGQWDYRFRVVDSKEVNAFALPGGNMFMFTGLLDRIKTDDELSAVTGHEMTHVRQEHWAGTVAEQTKRELGLSVILGLARASSTWQQIAGGVNGMLNLQYSRGHEFAADDGGLKNLLAAGYRPQGMIDLFKTLQKAGGDGGTPEFLRTHPLTSERIKRAENKIEALSDNNRDGSDQR